MSGNFYPSIDNLITGGEPSGLTIDEDNNHTFSVSDFGFNDADGDSNAYVKITQLPAAGSLTLNGTAVTVDQQIAAADITNLVFSPAANAHGNGYASIEFKVSDGTAESEAETLNIHVTAVADAPTTADNTVSLDEGGSHTFSASEFGFSDGDGDSLHSIKITQLPAAGSLTLNGSAVTANQVIVAADIPNLVFTPVADAHGAGYASFDFTVSDGSLESSAETMTFNVNEVNNAPTVEGDLYATPSPETTYTFDTFSSDGLTDTDFSHSTDGGGHLWAFDNGGNGISSVNFDSPAYVKSFDINALPWEGFSSPTTTSVTVKAFNGSTELWSATLDLTDNRDWSSWQTVSVGVANVTELQFSDVGRNLFWPSIDNLVTGGEPSGLTIDENSSHTFLVSDFGFTDVDGDALSSVKITQLPAAGSLTLNGSAVTANQVITAADIPNLVFTPAANTDGANYASMTFTVSDGALESAPATLTINVDNVDSTPANSAPVAADSAVTLDEDGSHTFSASEFGFTDSDGDALHSIKITQLPAAGSLTLSGTAVTANQVITAADIPNLVFTPAANANGAGYASFDFTVSDGTVESAAETMTLNVDAVNDAPTIEGDSFGASSTSSSPETTYTFDSSNHGLTQTNFYHNTTGGGHIYANNFDNDSSITFSSPTYVKSFDMNALFQQGATYNPSKKTVTIQAFNGSTEVWSETVDLTNHFDWNNWRTVSVETGNITELKVIANLNSGSRLRPSIDNLILGGEPSNNGITIDEDTSHTFAVSDFGFNDIDGDSLAYVKITQLPTAGSLTLNGSAVTVDQQISASDIPNLVFTPVANANGDSYANIQFKVSDGTAESAAETLNFNVTPVDDINTAPTATDMSLVTAESETHVFTVDDFGFSDADGDSLHSVTIKSLPTNGSLTYDGAAVFVNQVIAAADMSKLQFTASSVTTDTSTSFAFTVSDGTDSSAQNNFNVTTQDAVAQSDNLVTNGGATNGTTGWTIIQDGGDGWRTTSGSESHDGDGGAWSTSHQMASKSQTIDLLAKGFSTSYLDSAPDIDVSDWYKMVHDYGADDTYYLKVELRAADGSVIDSFNTGTLTATSSWTEAGTTFSNYGSGVRSIYIEHGGDDGEGWAGHYGTWIDDTSVRIGGEHVPVDGTSGNEILNGSAQADHLSGLGGNDVLIGGDGDDLLTGGTGADTFRFNSGDEGTSSAPATDTIEDFSTADGDVLDLSDMLVGESAATIDSFLDLSFVNGNTEISVKDGANGQTVQKIVLDGVDLSSLGSEADILNNLLNNGNLDIDQ